MQKTFATGGETGVDDIYESIKRQTKLELIESFSFYTAKIENAKEELTKVIKGQDTLIYDVLRSFVCNSNILLEGLPGLGKTVLCKCLAVICDIDFKRVQFTTDLLPSDIIGIVTYDKEHGFEVLKGPIFCNLLLADEINRAPPKVQSALLEAMGEHQVTLGNETHKLKSPFIVLATQNPIEQSGTFPLPEAQVDRFLFKINLTYPDEESELLIMDSNFNSKKIKDFDLKTILTRDDILIMQSLLHYIHVEKKIKKYIINIINSTRNPKEYNLKYAEMISMGASPRASIGLLTAAKAQALIKGRHYVIPQDIKDIILLVLRHRIFLNFKAKMNNVTTDDVIKDIINKIKIY